MTEHFIFIFSYFVFMCSFRNSKIMGCLPTRVKWISYKMKEIGLLKSSNTLAAQRSQYVCLTRLSTWSDKFSLNSNAWAFFFFFLNQVHRNTVQNEWQAFLNLCLAQETHLDNIEDYKKVKSRVVLPCHPIHPNPLNIYQSFLFFTPVPTWFRDVVWLPDQTQSKYGP